MRVRIYRPGKSAMQSGRAATKQWRIEPELESPRIPEPLMGWVSSEDTLTQIRLKFSTAEEAIRYAERMGWAYSCDAAQERVIAPRSYVDNFKQRESVS